MSEFFFLHIPDAPDSQIDWSAIEAAYHDWLAPLQCTEQDPPWHAEGNVLAHTKMACETLVQNERWQQLSSRDRNVLFMATLMHDIGKPLCTKTENGKIVSPKHGIKGAQLARSILWRKFGMSGEYERIKMREEIVSLIRFHSLPYRFWDRPNPLFTVVNASINVRCDYLALLSEADLLGRIADNCDESLSILDMFRQYAVENDCFDKPYPFKSAHSRYAYFAGILDHPAEELYDDTWGEIVMMSGLPASGKDTYIAKHLSHMPVISLDQLRQTMRVSWYDDQSPVIEAAREMAKNHMRKREPFVLNATNLSLQMRQSWLKLFRSYNARIRIVYLETTWELLLLRNKKRPSPVDESAIFKMLDKLEPPTLAEAHDIDWVSTQLS